MKQRSGVHRTPRDLPACVALKAALGTGNFALRIAALRRVAPIFRGHGNARYEWLLLVHLSRMARTTVKVVEALTHLFSTPLTGSPRARVGVDEQ